MIPPRAPRDLRLIPGPDLLIGVKECTQECSGQVEIPP